ncbi:hypothetical protein McpSp1_07180 [Methanocorpusculaceae archaeon Sp1]|nr:hypothetical protein [Methanocorpusculaceae archaeon Sp1]
MLTDIIVQGERKLSTGLAGLDEMIDGGFMENTVTALIGDSGIGRTTIALQFLVGGVTEGENVLFISLTHDINRLKKKLLDMYPWIEDKLDHQLHFMKLDPKNFDSLSYYLGNGLPELLRNLSISRLVIDPLTIYEESLRINDNVPIMSVYHIYWTLKSIPCTSFIVLSTSSARSLQSMSGYSEEFADNVILLFREFPKDTYLNPYKKVLLVLKTRYNRHEHSGKVLEFDERGVAYLTKPENV